jgi:hypothetical protein
MDMNNAFAKEGSLYSPRTEKLIQPIAAYCEKVKAAGWTIIALSDTHDEHDVELQAFPEHSMAGTEGPDIVAELRPYCDYILPKYTTGGFFEMLEASKSNPAYDLRAYDEIHLVGCCTDLCIFNFAVITQKHMEYEFHMKRLDRIPSIVIEMPLVDTYDGLGHDAEMINAFYPRHMELNGMKVNR